MTFTISGLPHYMKCDCRTERRRAADPPAPSACALPAALNGSNTAALQPSQASMCTARPCSAAPASAQLSPLQSASGLARPALVEHCLCRRPCSDAVHSFCGRMQCLAGPGGWGRDYTRRPLLERAGPEKGRRAPCRRRRCVGRARRHLCLAAAAVQLRLGARHRHLRRHRHRRLRARPALGPPCWRHPHMETVSWRWQTTGRLSSGHRGCSDPKP